MGGKIIIDFAKFLSHLTEIIKNDDLEHYPDSKI